MADDFSQFMQQPAAQTSQVASPPPSNDFSQFMQPQQTVGANLSSPSQQPGGLMMNNPASDTIQAAVGGAVKGATNMVAGSIGMGGDTYKDPMTVIHDIRQGKDLNVPSTPPDLLSPQIKQKMAENPITTMGGEFVGGTATIAAITAITKGAISPITGIMKFAGLDGGVITTLAANGLANSIVAGPGNRLWGGATGVVTSAAGEIIGGMASKGQAIATVGQQTKDAVSKVNETITGDPGTIAVKSRANMWNTSKAADDQLFDSFKSVEGKVEASPIINRASIFLHENADELTPAQSKATNTLIQNVANAKNLDDLHTARKVFAYDYSKFTEGKPLTGEAFQGFQGVKGTIDSVMENNANMLGVGDKYAAANNFYKSTMLPLINSGAKDTADALANSKTDPMAAAKLADTELAKYVNTNKPQQAQEYLNTLDPTGKQAFEVHSVNSALKAATTNGITDSAAFMDKIRQIQQAIPGIHSERTMGIINGLNKVVNEATTIAGINVNVSKIPGYAKVGGIASSGAAVGAMAGGPTGVLIGGAVSLAVAKMVNSKAGQTMLIRLGSPTGRSLLQGFLNSTLMNAEMNREKMGGKDQVQLTNDQEQMIMQQNQPQQGQQQ